MPTHSGSQRRDRRTSGWRVFSTANRSRPALVRRLHGVEALETRRLLAGDYSASGLMMAEGAGRDPMPDFSLIDMNRHSETYNQSVSPRDFVAQDKVSAYYFASGL